MRKRIISLVLTSVMLLSMMPLTAMAKTDVFIYSNDLVFPEQFYSSSLYRNGNYSIENAKTSVSLYWPAQKRYLSGSDWGDPTSYPDSNTVERADRIILP